MEKKVEVGGICLSIHSNSKIVGFIEDHFKDFLSKRAPDFRIEMGYKGKVDPAQFLGVSREKLGLFLKEPRVTNKSSRLWITGKKRAKKGGKKKQSRPSSSGSGNELRIFDLGDRTLVQRRDFAGYVNLGTRTARAIIRENLENIGIDSFLRICFSFLAIAFNGLVLHSAGLEKAGKGYVFFGPSDTGKSTIASLSSDRCTLLSDEFVIVRKIKNDYYVYGSPFYGDNEEMGINRGSKLSAAFVPKKDTEVYIRKVKPAEVLSKLLAAVMFFGKETSLNKRLLEIASDFISTVPCYEMHFQKNDSFWQSIDEVEAQNRNLITEKV